MALEKKSLKAFVAEYGDKYNRGLYPAILDTLIMADFFDLKIF